MVQEMLNLNILCKGKQEFYVASTVKKNNCGLKTTMGINH